MGIFEADIALLSFKNLIIAPKYKHKTEAPLFLRLRLNGMISGAQSAARNRMWIKRCSFG
jgi:hypothetical protein